ncbi:hypothetical protein TNCV_2118581 [Trichonephila clavipes]|nr:hypothetical protein TNCV_2118581 [Trichonephila clavipes]
MCHLNNYKNSLPAGRLIPIVSNYPNVIDLLGPYPAQRVRRNRYVLVITDHIKISDGIGGTEFAVEDIEKCFDEARSNTKVKHEKWAKYYDRQRRDVRIKVNDWVLVITHPLSSAAQKVVAKFKLKFEGLYRVRRDHHPALGQNQIEEPRSVERRLGDLKDRGNLDLDDQRGNAGEMKQGCHIPTGTNYGQEKVQNRNPDHPMRRGHNKEDQFDPEETENNSTAPTTRSKEGQAAGVPEAEEVSNSIGRRGQEKRANSRRSQSLEVLVGDVNYKT